MSRVPLLAFLVLALVASLSPAGALGLLGDDLPEIPLVVSVPGGFSSDNVEYVGTVPLDSPGVSAKVRDVAGQRLLYVSGAKGITIYDIADPARPSPIGGLLLPHSQNEDVQVSEDGSRLIVAADGQLPVLNPVTMGLHIIDTSDPTNPRWVGWLDELGGGTNHTAACADAACEWIYGNRGAIYHVPRSEDGGDVTDRIEVVGSWFALDERVTTSHALNRSVNADGTPIMVSDSTPRLVIDVTDPAAPKLLATSDPEDHTGDGLLQHNNLRPNAGQWTPRRGQSDERNPNRGGDPFGGRLRPGELLIGNSESNLQPQCGDNAGGLTTFSIADFDKGATMQPLHSYRPANGDWVTAGDSPANGLGCSGHWFDIRDGDNLIAASWYEHGIKIIEVAEDYSMHQVGFYQPVATEAGAAYWVTGDDGSEYIYSVDYARGIDIVRFHRDPALRPSEAEVGAAWLAAAGRIGAFAEAERLVCRLR